MRLLAEARTEYQGPVGMQYFDTTFSVDKTISLAHASALASAVETLRLHRGPVRGLARRITDKSGRMSGGARQEMGWWRDDLALRRDGQIDYGGSRAREMRRPLSLTRADCGQAE